MDSYLIGALSAAWLGILTSISPCPLATNIAAISYVGRKVKSSRYVLTTGLIYTAGRMLTYFVISIIIVASLLSIPEIAQPLQKYINMVLGPLLILISLFLLEIIRIGSRTIGTSQDMEKRVDRWGIWGAGLLGILFALSFCPISAALFFGSLIPLSAKHHSIVLFPLLYGAGTALPVVIFSFLLAFGAQSIGKLFNRLTVIERWTRRVTGVIIAVVGIYYTLLYTFSVPL